MLQSLKNLNADDVRRNLITIKQLIREVHPNLALDRGPFHDSVAYYSAIFATANQQDVANALKVMNVAKMHQEAHKTPSNMVDRVAANWMVKRKQSTRAKGLVTFVLSKPGDFIIPKGLSLKAGNQEFITDETHFVRANANSSLAKTDRLLIAADGRWIVTIKATAVLPGSDGNISNGCTLIAAQKVHSNITHIFAGSDFTYGNSTESNHQVMERLHHAAATKLISNRANIDALIRSFDIPYRVVAVSIVGFSDIEMQRDKTPLWPGKIGGCVDIYVKLEASGNYAVGIKLLQQLLSTRDKVSLTSNILVKAPIPCAVKTKVEIFYKDKKPDKATLEDTIAATINNTGFVGRLAGTTISQVITPLLSASMLVKSVSLSGRITYPNKEEIYLEWSDVLEVPDEPVKTISYKTVAFVQAQDDVELIFTQT